MKSLTTIIALLIAAIMSHAQIIRPVASAYTLEWGASLLEDTYLTPLKYKGCRSAFNYEGSQAMKFDPECWIMRFDFGVDFASDKNPAQNAKMTAFAVNADWNMLRRWRLPHSIAIGAGAGAELSGGVLYLSRNGNNPASAKASATINATAYIAWNWRMWRLPFTLRYQASLPLTGVFFSPDYGQLYYQIYMGDNSHLVHGAWWGNYFVYNHLLTADLHLGNVSLRIGYRGKIFSSKVNNLIANDFSHSLVLGIVTDWVTLGRKAEVPAGKVVKAYRQ